MCIIVILPLVTIFVASIVTLIKEVKTALEMTERITGKKSGNQKKKHQEEKDFPLYKLFSSFVFGLGWLGYGKQLFLYFWPYSYEN